MQRSPGPGSTNRSPRRATLGLRRLAAAAVGGAVVVVTATSQVGAAPVAGVPVAADPGGKAGATGYWAAPTELPQPATLAVAEPAVDRAARLLAENGLTRTVASVGAPSEADLTDIPSPALAAYQRAAVVIGQAMPGCGLDWELLAAIGRVESDHGRFRSTLDARGVARPAIVGVPLTGGNGTRRIVDSDAGALDGDRVLDRAVGPLQFLPSTWSVVGVDGDGDGARNPQDIDDAALAAAVYLCGDREDLATAAGRQAAVLTYNRSESYVDTVLALRRAYSQGRPAAAVPAVSSVDVGPGSTRTTPAGAAPLARTAQRTAEQQRRAEKPAAAEAKRRPAQGADKVEERAVRDGERRPTGDNRGAKDGGRDTSDEGKRPAEDARGDKGPQSSKGPDGRPTTDGETGTGETGTGETGGGETGGGETGGGETGGGETGGGETGGGETGGGETGGGETGGGETGGGETGGGETGTGTETGGGETGGGETGTGTETGGGETGGGETGGGETGGGETGTGTETGGGETGGGETGGGETGGGETGGGETGTGTETGGGDSTSEPKSCMDVEYVLSDGTVYCLEELLADPSLYEDPDVRNELVSLEFEPPPAGA